MREYVKERTNLRERKRMYAQWCCQTLLNDDGTSLLKTSASHSRGLRRELFEHCRSSKSDSKDPSNLC